MTDEQIKQAAIQRGCIDGTAEYYGFIEGAQYYRAQQPNPWISVDERLPEKAIGLYELEEDEQHKMVLIKTANGSLYSGYLDAEEIWRAFTVPYKGAYPISAITWSRATHWMPMPKVPSNYN